MSGKTIVILGGGVSADQAQANRKELASWKSDVRKMVARRTRSEEKSAPTAYGVRRQGTPSARRPVTQVISSGPLPPRPKVIPQLDFSGAGLQRLKDSQSL